jgi:hypothetical protein
VFLIFIYLTTLFIAPQLWVEPFVDMRVDLYIYPVWALTAYLFPSNNKFIITAQDKFFLLMVLWIVLSTMVNGFHDRSNEIILNYSKWFVLYKLVSTTVSSIDHVKKVGGMLLFFAVVLAIEGIQHMTGESGLGWAGQTLGWIDPSAAAAGEPGRTRWINIFDGPGVFCVIYTIALPFALHFLSPTFTKGMKIIAVATTALLLVAIYYTGSRGGFLTTLALISLFIALRYKISLSKIFIIGGIVTVAFVLAPSYLTTMDDPSRSAKHRIDMWIEGVEMVQQNPVFGIGKGNFQGYTGRLIAHNSSIEIMGETGVIGLFFWFGLIYISFKNLVCYALETDDPVGMSYVSALGLAVAGYLISSMFVTLEYETLYFLLGVCAGVGYLVKQPIQFTEKDFWRLSVITIGWIVGMKAFLVVYA